MNARRGGALLALGLAAGLAVGAAGAVLAQGPAQPSGPAPAASPAPYGYGPGMMGGWSGSGYGPGMMGGWAGSTYGPGMMWGWDGGDASAPRGLDQTDLDALLERCDAVHDAMHAVLGGRGGSAGPAPSTPTPSAR